MTVEAEDLLKLVWLKQLSNALMNRINRNYRFVMGFNGALILLGAFGVLAPAASALLHNTSTILLSMDCLTELLPENPQRFDDMKSAAEAAGHFPGGLSTCEPAPHAALTGD